ncbi:hypothetical protein WJ972_04425 [Achromobacter insuavis]
MTMGMPSSQRTLGGQISHSSALVVVAVGQQVVQRHGMHEHARDHVVHRRQHGIVETAQRRADHDVAPGEQILQACLVGVGGAQFR